MTASAAVNTAYLVRNVGDVGRSMSRGTLCRLPTTFRSLQYEILLKKAVAPILYPTSMEASVNYLFSAVCVRSGLTLLALCSPALAQSEPGTGFDVTSYELALTPDIANKTLAGRQTILLRSTVDGLRRS